MDLEKYRITDIKNNLPDLGSSPKPMSGFKYTRLNWLAKREMRRSLKNAIKEEQEVDKKTSSKVNQTNDNTKACKEISSLEKKNDNIILGKNDSTVKKLFDQWIGEDDNSYYPLMISGQIYFIHDKIDRSGLNISEITYVIKDKKSNEVVIKTVIAHKVHKGILEESGSKPKYTLDQYLITTESLKIYDKAAWHIDGGERADRVLKSLKETLQFLHDNNMLTPEGEEIYKTGVDTSYSLHERMVNRDGKEFLESKYSGNHTYVFKIMNSYADSIIKYFGKDKRIQKIEKKSYKGLSLDIKFSKALSNDEAEDLWDNKIKPVLEKAKDEYTKKYKIQFYYDVKVATDTGILVVLDTDLYYV